MFAAPALLSLAASATAQDAPSPASPPTPPAAAAGPPLPHVAVRTDQGTITLALDTRNAPVTASNFLRYVDQKRFDGTVFYRAMRLDWGTQPNGLIQGGTQNDPKRILPPIAHEPTSQTGILHKPGTISMARHAPGSANGDFSILLSELSGLDANANAADPDVGAGFAAFGHVVDGMDVVRRIYDSPLSPTAGQGPLKGQMLEPPVKILTMRRVPAPVVATPAPDLPPAADLP